MTDFTDQDRERAQKTLTLLEQHVKLSDERHAETRSLISDHNKKFKDHERRLSRGETFRAWLIGATGLGGLGALTKWLQ